MVKNKSKSKTVNSWKKATDYEDYEDHSFSDEDNESNYDYGENGREIGNSIGKERKFDVHSLEPKNPSHWEPQNPIIGEYRDNIGNFGVHQQPKQLSPQTPRLSNTLPLDSRLDIPVEYGLSREMRPESERISVTFDRVASMWIVFSVGSRGDNHKNGILEGAINWLCGYRHCEFVFLLKDQQSIVCSIPYGGTVSFAPKKYRDGDCEWYEVLSTHQGVSNAIKFCEDQIGKGFNSTGLYTSLLPLFCRMISQDSKGDYWFCSELCAGILYSIDSEKYHHCRSSKICPRRLENLLKQQNDVTSYV